MESVCCVVDVRLGGEGIGIMRGFLYLYIVIWRGRVSSFSWNQRWGSMVRWYSLDVRNFFDIRWIGLAVWKH